MKIIEIKKTQKNQNQNIHPVPPKITKISVTGMKFHGASIGKGPRDPKYVKNRFFNFGAPIGTKGNFLA